MIVEHPIEMFNPLVVPSSFFDSWTVEEQIIYIAENAQGKLIAGDNITITPNEDGTYTISATGGGGGGGTGATYRIRQNPNPAETSEAEYFLQNMDTMEQSGVTIVIPKTVGVESIITIAGTDKETVTITLTNGTVQSFDIPYGRDGRDGADGAQGVPGVTPDITVSGSVLPMGGSALPVVRVTKSGTAENPNFDFEFANLKGEKGDKGEKGEQGEPGAPASVPNITVSGSISPIASSAAPVVTVTKSGTDMAPNFDFEFANLKGDKGEAGTDGVSPTITVREITGGHQIEIVSVGGTERFDIMDGTNGTDGTDGISPTVTVRDITGGHQIEIVSAGGTERFDVMDGTDGADGQPGAPGATGVTPNITVSGSISPIASSAAPVVTVTKSGTAENPNFDFLFANLKGEKGDTGAAGQNGSDGISPTVTVRDITGGHQIEIVSAGGTERFDVMDGTDGQDGQPGTPGATGATPNITVSGSISPIAGSVAPIVTVTKTGTAENPNFDFEFANLKGAKGDNGVGVPSGGTAGQILTKNSATDYDARWGDAPSGDSYLDNLIAKGYIPKGSSWARLHTLFRGMHDGWGTGLYYVYIDSLLLSTKGTGEIGSCSLYPSNPTSGDTNTTFYLFGDTDKLIVNLNHIMLPVVIDYEETIGVISMVGYNDSFSTIWGNFTAPSFLMPACMISSYNFHSTYQNYLKCGTSKTAADTGLSYGGIPNIDTLYIYDISATNGRIMFSTIAIADRTNLKTYINCGEASTYSKDTEVSFNQTLINGSCAFKKICDLSDLQA